MSLLTLWSASLILAGISILTMLGLVFARLLRDRRAWRQNQLRRELAHRIFRWLEGELPDEVVLGVAAKNSTLLASLAGELLGLVRGHDRDRLVAIFERAGLPGYLRRQLRHHRGSNRIAAAEALRDFPGPMTTQALLQSVQRGKGELKIAAALALADLNALPDARLLARWLGIGTLAHTRLSIDLFRRIAPSQTEALLAIAEGDDWPELARTVALEGLGSTSNYTLADRIGKIALKSGGNLAAKALQALAELGHPGAGHAVEAGLSSPDVSVRVQAANAAGRIGLSSLAGRLAALLSDDVWWVRFRAAEALIQLGAVGRDRLAAIAREGTGPAAQVASLVMAEKNLH